jgi:trimethylamine--corrinoid protein Co-methyltransferase
MLGHCQRCVRGIDASEATLSADTIAEVCLNGPGHYLGGGQPSRTVPADYFYPAIGDRLTPREWCEKGKPDLLQKAVAEKKRILAERFPRHVSKAIDDRLRARFGDLIKLPRSAMGWRS